MSKGKIFKYAMFLFALVGITALAFIYDWKAGAISWLIACCAGTAMLLEAEYDDKGD